jgi:hypothetical protein
MAETRNSRRLYSAIARQRRGKHLSDATNKQATGEEPLENMLYTRSVSSLYNEDKRKKLARRILESVFSIES